MDKKRILFIGVGFHEYDTYIIEHLKKEYDVWYLNSNSFKQKHPYLLWLTSLFSKRKAKEITEKGITSFIESTKSCNFDLVFIISCVNVSQNHLNSLKRYHPKAKFVLYLWDEWEYRKLSLSFIKENFNEVYSFDSEDCRKYGFKLRPLFYIGNNRPKLKDYDVCFVGNQHSNRLETMHELKKQCQKNSLKYRFVVTMTISVYLRNMLRSIEEFRSDKDILHQGAISYAEYEKIISNSKTVVDIHRPTQSGLTMRTIESLASGSKVLTTNKHILEYKNIPSDMYYVWNMKVDENLIEFIKTSKTDFVLDSYYSIDSFLNEVLQ